MLKNANEKRVQEEILEKFQVEELEKRFETWSPSVTVSASYTAGGGSVQASTTWNT